MPEPPSPLPERGVVLRELLEAAGRAALRHFGAPRGVRRKEDGSVVTDADLDAERVLLDGLRARWPGDATWSEESGSEPTGPEPAWTIDPIDGTSGFVEGLAYWGPTVARCVRDAEGRRHVECGATWLPRLGEHYHVEGGVGWFDGAPLPTLADRPPRRVVYLPSDFHRHAALRYPCKARCLGGTAAHLALVARGAALAAIVGPGWSPWDATAGLALIGAVGGKAVRLSDGAPLDPFDPTGPAFVAGEARVVDELSRGDRVVPLHSEEQAHGS
ncbi:MAG: inositol monophosphatase family protein [Myxococcota bacterium]